MPEIKVVLDTNIFVSSFFGGNPEEIISLWKNEEIILCLSKDILDEYIRVLAEFDRTDIQHKIKDLLALFATGFNMKFVHHTERLKVVTDPADDKFIECAVASAADYIVSGDKALLKIENYQTVKIATPPVFLKTFG